MLIDPELGLNVNEPFDPLMLPDQPRLGQEVAPEYFVAGNIRGTEFFIEKNGCLHGQCRLYYVSKAVKGDMFYAEGKLHGPAIYFSEEGRILSTSWYLRGKQQGKCYWYYSDGSLYSLQRYKDGLYHGAQEYFHPDGTVKTVINYDRGVIQKAFLAEKEMAEQCCEAVR
jgi:antitoxin component YwqK of YwqJK toxin-antitoxin module